MYCAIISLVVFRYSGDGIICCARIVGRIMKPISGVYDVTLFHATVGKRRSGAAAAAAVVLVVATELRSPVLFMCIYIIHYNVRIYNNNIIYIYIYK